MEWMKRLVGVVGRLKEINMRNRVYLLGEAEKVKLLRDIQEAHAAWLTAKQQLDIVDAVDQVDCAIYPYEAAQQKYEMLIREAKVRGLRAEPRGGWSARACSISCSASPFCRPSARPSRSTCGRLACSPYLVRRERSGCCTSLTTCFSDLRWGRYFFVCWSCK